MSTAPELSQLLDRRAIDASLPPTLRRQRGGGHQHRVERFFGGRVIAKSQILGMEALAGTEKAGRDELAPDRWFGHNPGLA